MDLAIVEFLRASCPGFGFFEYHLVKQTVEWKSPARFDDVLELTVSTLHVGTSSFTLSTEIRIAGQEQVINLSETVNVLIAPTTMKKTSIPDDLRKTLERGAPGVTVDHAAYFRQIKTLNPAPSRSTFSNCSRPVPPDH
ncbi:MAG: hotdog domain-containing protein [Deltaproteobacteria bacterium]